MTGFLVAIAAGTATAQTNPRSSEESDKGGRIKITLGQPANGDTRSVLGSPIIGFGAGYDIPQKGAKANSTFVPATSIEYAAKSKTKDGERVDLSYIGLIGEGRYYFSSETKSTGFGRKTRTPTGLYAGFGTGFYYLKYKRQESGVTKDDVRGFKFGYKFLAGFQIKNGLYLEADYTRPGNANAALYNLSIGFRVASNVGG